MYMAGKGEGATEELVLFKTLQIPRSPPSDTAHGDFSGSAFFLSRSVNKITSPAEKVDRK